MLFSTTLNDRFWNTDPANGAYHFIDQPYSLNLPSVSDLPRGKVAMAGENLAATWASLAGWQTIYQRLRHIGFELDVVLEKNNIFRILEVKTIRNSKFTPDFDSTQSWLNTRKMSSLIKGANFLFYTLSRQKIKIVQLSCELIVINLRGDCLATIYRWPDACTLS
jgi:Holliday junction resolvase-like predicted endonuclease